MLKVLKPNKNKPTGGYSNNHKGYDHSGKGDQNYYSSFHGVITQSKSSETKNWIAGNRKLTTNDYGNYLIVKANVDGKTIYQLGAHFKQGTVLPKGTEVQKGQVIAQIGNTGNSTGAHSHTEYRDENSKNFEVDLVDEEPDKPKMELRDKRQEIVDIYYGITGEYPSDDEISARLQEDEDRVSQIRARLGGDDRAKEYWSEKWGRVDPVIKEGVDWEAEAKENKMLADSYKDSYVDLKSTLGLSVSDNTQDVEAKVKAIMLENKKVLEMKIPETVYKINGKDFEKIFSLWGSLVLINEKGA